jgi:hypothetical protein
MAMQAFSHPGAFSVEEQQAIGPVILVVLRAVIVGCYAVLEYLDETALRLEQSRIEKIWEKLDEKDGSVYLRQWKEGDRVRV